MFLFTSTPAPEKAPATTSPVAGALRDASDRTGISFDYLVKTAQRESNFDPAAKAPTSSATGLFQFLEQTWLGLVKTDGARLGLSGAAGQVVDAGGGRLTIADPQTKAQVLALRENPQVSATMAGVFTARNREALTQSLGRPPSEGELYIAHFLGAGGAGELVRLAANAPDTKVAAVFPEAANANRSIFFERGGRARSAGEVYAHLVSAHENAAPPALPELAATKVAVDPNAPENAATALPAGKPILGLFRSLNPQSATEVRQTWLNMPDRRTARNEGPRQTYFPRTEANVSVSFEPPPGSTEAAANAGAVAAKPEPSAAVVDSGPRMVDVPLPPRRPKSFAPVSRSAGNAREAAGQPLDLLSFMRKRS
jgi:Transglycosylase SLT domain